MSFIGGNDVVVGRILLQHQPHRLDVLLRIAPVPLGIKVSQDELILQAKLYA